MFGIEIKKLYWADNSLDDPDDLCLHGDVAATIGGERMEDSCTLSAGGLYLLKTLTENHIIGEDNQMLPHCGHFLIPNETNDTVDISGCPYGIDWSVVHKDGKIELTTESGNTVWLESRRYESVVKNFADEIRSFYERTVPRKVPGADLRTADFDRKGYVAFWNEWFRRYDPSRDSWFCPAVSRSVGARLCGEYRSADRGASPDVSDKLKRWIAENDYYQDVEDFHAVCKICSHSRGS